ncbi:MAG: hypothetical protein ACK5PB_00150 [Pirellula sp.]|jgi:hypothetical protein
MWIYELRINASDPKGSAKELYEAIRYWPQLGIVSIVDDYIVAVFEGATQHVCRNIIERLRNQPGVKSVEVCEVVEDQQVPGAISCQSFGQRISQSLWSGMMVSSTTRPI